MEESTAPLAKEQQDEKTTVVATENTLFRLFEPDEVIPESYLKEDIKKEFGLDIDHLTDESKRKWIFLRADLWGYTEAPDDASSPLAFTINGMQAYVDETSKNTDLSPYTKEKLVKIQRLINHIKAEPLCPIDRPVKIRKTFIPEITDAPILDAKELAEVESILKNIPFPKQEQIAKESPQQELFREFNPVKKELSVTNTNGSTPSPIPAAPERSKPKLVKKENNTVKEAVKPSQSINKPASKKGNKITLYDASEDDDTDTYEYNEALLKEVEENMQNNWETKGFIPTSSPTDYLYYTCKKGIMYYHTFGGAKVIREEPRESDYATVERLKLTYLNRFAMVIPLYSKDPNAILRSGVYEAYFAEGEKMGDNFDRMPYGIINKSYTGIGATTLELRAKRNSIIVVPTRILAATKHTLPEFKDKTLYVGSSLEFNDTTTGTPIKVSAPQDTKIKKYLENKNIPYKKFLVVADSLDRVLQCIGTPQVYTDYFLMVDEADILQSDSTFRDSLPAVIDHYLDFKKKNRCLVSATIEHFSHPRLQQEPQVRIKYPSPPRRNIEMIYTSEINAALCDKIEKLHAQNPHKKILIAYNSIRDILDIINNLDEQIRHQCTVLCSKTTENRDRIGPDYFEELSGDKLPSQIVFISCAYFVGIDINEDFHLICVSTPHRPYTLLSPNKLTQIAGRCRSPHKLLSDTIIYHSLENEERAEGGIYNFRNYQKQLQYKADKVVELYKTADIIAGEDEALTELFDNVKSAIQSAAGEKTRSGILPLTRTTIHCKQEPHYFNIDALAEQRHLMFNLYQNQDQLPTSLQKLGHTVHVDIIPTVKPDYEDFENDYTPSEAYLAGIEKLCDIIRESPVNNDDDRKNIQTRGREYPTFTKQYLELCPYVPLENLLEQLTKFAGKRDQRAYNNYYQSVMFWCLPEKHNFKKLILSNFEVDQCYSSAEIQEQLNVIFRPHYQFVSKKAAVSFLKNCVKTSPDRHKGHKIKGYYPTCQKIEPLKQLPVADNNLVKIFRL